MKTDNDKFCILPWLHLHVAPDGKVLPCCISDKDAPLGDIQQQDISDIMNSPQAKTLRLNMLNGVESPGCKYCYQQEAAGMRSYRMNSNNGWPKIIPTVEERTQPDGTIEFTPYYLDIRLNNICNLKCRWCSGYYSSGIQQEELELTGKNSHNFPILQRKDRSIPYDKIKPHLSTVKHIYFAGGEPLIMPEHYQILQELISCGNTNVSLFYNTNLTRLSYKDINVLKLWSHFRNITIGASLDAEGSVAGYMRHGTVWSDIEDNILQIQTHCPHARLVVSSTLGITNTESLIRLQRILIDKYKIQDDQFDLSFVYGPDYMCIQALPDHHKQRLSNIINDHIGWLETNSFTILAGRWQSVLKFMMERSLYESTYRNFITETNILDNHRNESFHAVFPEFSDLLPTDKVN